MANNTQKNFTSNISKLLERIKEKKIYGSIEIYFEGGEVTQITQRIINKISRAKGNTMTSKKKKTNPLSQVKSSEDISPEASRVI
ncbi:DUF2292 domain-containing protein [Candidatus Daviesbacteria bacterium]|nr:DUF2292 domain-containing protein [Candidatus Daviesbacteria bacterium]